MRPRLRGRGGVKRSLIHVWTAEAHARFHIHRVVESDPVDPGAEFSFTAIRFNGVVGLEEHLLRHILRFRNELPPQNRDGEAKHARAVPADQFLEGLLVAVLGAGYELGIALRRRQRSVPVFRK